MDINGAPLNSYLTLGGDRVCCARELRDNGSLRHSTPILSVDRSQEVVDTARRTMALEGFTNFCAFPGELSSAHSGILKHVQPIDFAFLDFCNHPTWKVCHWVRTILQKNMSDNAWLAITSNRRHRGRPFRGTDKISKEMFRGTDFLSATERMLRPKLWGDKTLTEHCVIMLAYFRAFMPNFAWRPEVVIPYHSDKRCDMISARIRIHRQPKDRVQVPAKLLERTAA